MLPESKHSKANSCLLRPGLGKRIPAVTGCRVCGCEHGWEICRSVVLVFGEGGTRRWLFPAGDTPPPWHS